MNRKIKKIAIFSGLALVCVGAMSLVLVHANAGEAPESSSSTPSAEMVLATPNSIAGVDSDEGTSSTFVPSSGAVASTPLTTVSKPTSVPPKPTPPASSTLTNKAKKPTYSSTPKAPTNSASSKPSGGKPGQNYVPGFGWVTPPGKGEMIKSPNYGGDINKQIGSMD